MNIAVFAAGVVLLVAAFVDLLWTTIAVSRGRGPLTHVVADSLWRVAVRVNDHSVLRWTGYAVILLVPLLWVVFVYGGFALMFLSEPGSVQQASPPYGPAGTVGTAAYAAGGLAGAGAGFVASGEWWQFLNNVSALVGLAVFTFVITYLFQTVTAVSQQRSVAATIDGLGEDPVDVVATALAEARLGQLPSQLTAIVSELNSIARKRTALPILQFFHVGDRAQSIALNVAILDEIVTLLDLAVEEPYGTVVRPGRQAVDDYLETTAFALSADAPPIPDLSPLHDRADVEGASDRIARLSDRRSNLHALVRQEGWRWSDVYPDRFDDTDPG